MFSPGDIIFYGSTGVCRVEEVKMLGFSKSEKQQLYYILKPVYQECNISAPVDSNKVFMRPVITKEEAMSLIDTIPSIKAEAFHCSVLRQLVEHYEAAFASHECSDLIKLTMSIQEKKRLCQEHKRKLGALDERFMKRAEDLLFGELAVALGIEKSDVPDYISQRLGMAESEVASVS